MRARALSVALVAVVATMAYACGSDGGDGGPDTGLDIGDDDAAWLDAGADGRSDGAADTSVRVDGSGSDGSTDGSTDGSDTGGADGGGSLPIGEWTDTKGVCPAGTKQVDLHTTAELSAATRGEGAYAGDGPGTCYFLHDGTYSQNGSVLLWFKHGGTASSRVWYVGESRAGVVIHARGTFDVGGDHVTVSNMTFDLTGYSNGGNPFNTLDLLASDDVTVSHVTFTGDCTVGHNGGHLETTGATHALIEACLIEKYGACGAAGHQDHGIYLSAGSDITVRNNVIRGNASRGIQMYTQSGSFGTLSRIVIEQNRITENGHGDYEDGIVLNADASGTIDHVTIRRNLFYRNWYSGIRFSFAATSAIVIEHNTFFGDGLASTGGHASEINLDHSGSGAGATISGNLFGGSIQVINDGCYDAASRAFSIEGDFAQTAPTTLPPCVSKLTTGDPEFVDAAAGDFHPTNTAAAAFGAYAP